MNTAAFAAQYRDEILHNVLPFWQQHSLDREAGGYFTCLRSDGTVFDTDKFVWLQARQVWTFAMLYNRLEQRGEWLEIARHGADFLEQHGRDAHGSWYFSLTRAGRPLVQPYNIFSDCFAAMAFAQMYVATQEDRYAELARSTFTHILRRQDNPKGPYEKSVPGTRPLRNFALPMILCNLCLELESLLEATVVEATIATCIHDVTQVFYHTPTGLLLENVDPDGRFSDSFDGRLLNPGHAIEATWFLLDLARRNDDAQLVQTSTDILLRTLQYGWDETHGGLFYFLDLHGHPPQQLEWDQKLWWVHLESLVALAKAYALTRDDRCGHWFERVHRYTWTHFPDTTHGEWWGYLDRRGDRLLDLKGGKWKGCFHVPRGLYYVWRTLEECKNSKPKGLPLA